MDPVVGRQKDISRVIAVTRPTEDFSKAESFELMQGGAGTSLRGVSADSFSDFSANITFAEEQEFKLGNALFRKLWVSSPSSTQASDGLGPLFNARACQSCLATLGDGMHGSARRHARGLSGPDGTPFVRHHSGGLPFGRFYGA